MTLRILPTDREIIRSGPQDQAEALLASMINAGLTMADMGEVAIDLFRAER
jgi:hypothetical protein